jgi:hypothetical protein
MFRFPCTYLLVLALSFLLLGLWFAAPSQAAATTYYVATNGNDSNPCSSTSPCKTIAKGMEKLSSGDTLIIRGGTYNESVMLNVKSGTDQAYTTIKAAPGETVWIRPTAFQTKPYARILQAGPGIHHVRIERINLDGSGLPNDPNVSVTGYSTSNTPWTHHLIFDGGEVKHTRGDATFLRHTYGSIIRNSYIHDVGPSRADTSPAVCVYMQSYDPGQPPNIVENNRFDKTEDGSCISVLRVPNGIIRGNHISNISGGGIALRQNSTNVLAYNNIIRDSNVGITFNHLPDNKMKVYNNTIYKTSNGCIQQGNVTAKLTTTQAALVKNNICFQTGRADWVTPGNLTSDPKFVNASAGNFRLQQGSPSIDKGVTLPEVPCDFDGNRRPAGFGYDIGAFEYGSSPQTASEHCGSSSGTPHPPAYSK